MAAEEGKEAGNFAADATTEAADDVSDYLDVGMLEFREKDFQTIRNIRKLSDTAWDKLTFTIFTMDIILTGFLGGYVPQHYYIFYTAKAVPLLIYRWYTFKKMKMHYRFLDFCYFTNILILLYLWLPSYFNTVRAMLFPTIFGFANGPLLASIALWRDSLVPHSVEKMTTVFLHVSPGLSLWGIRWFSTDEQGFPLSSASDPEGGIHFDIIWEIVIYPIIIISLWQWSVIVVIFFWRRQRIEERQYETTYTLTIKRGYLYKLSLLCGPKYRKHMFVVWQHIYFAVSMFLVYPCYYSREFNIGLACVILTVASYNGATFYIDVFSQRYYQETVLKQKKT